MSSIGDLVANLTVNSKGWSDGLSKANAGLKAFASQSIAALSSVTAMAASTLGAGVSLAAADQDVRATQRLEGVLAATGNAAGLTAGQIGNYASELQRSTNFADEVTNQAAALLATFRNLSGDTFKKTLSLAQDLAELREIPLTDAAMSLGKALNSPAEGLAKLSKMGIQFTASEKAAIKAMSEMGDTAGAQKVMLKALEESFGGVAAKAASPLIQIKNYIGDLGEEVGKRLLPYVKLVADLVKNNLPAWGPWIAQSAVAVGALVLALKSVQAVLKGVAVTQALVQSLSGPKGWASLAVGAAIFAATVGTLEVALAGVSKESEAATRNMRGVMQGDMGGEGVALPGGAAAHFQERADAALKAVREFNTPAGLEKLQVDIRNISEAFNVLWTKAKLAGDSVQVLNAIHFQKQDAIAKMVDNFTGFSGKLEEVNNQIRILQGTATAASIELEKMAQAGISPAKIKEMEDAIKKRDELQKNKDFWKDVKEKGKEVTDALKTPEQKFADEEQRLKNLRGLGGIKDDETLNKAIEKARQDILADKAGDKAGGKTGALSKGSAEAQSAILTAMRESRGEKDIPKKQLDAQEQAVAQLESVNTAIDKLGENGVALFAGSLS